MGLVCMREHASVHIDMVRPCTHTFLSTTKDPPRGNPATGAYQHIVAITTPTPIKSMNTDHSKSLSTERCVCVCVCVCEWECV